MPEQHPYVVEPVDPKHQGADQVYHVFDPENDAYERFMMRRENYGPVLGEVSLHEALVEPDYSQYFREFESATGIYVPTVLETQNEAGEIVQLVDAIRGQSLQRAVQEGLVSLDECDGVLESLPGYIQRQFMEGKTYPADAFALGQYMYGTPELTHEQMWNTMPRIAMVDVSPILEKPDPNSAVDARFATVQCAYLADMVLRLEASVYDAPHLAANNDHGATMRRLRAAIDESLHSFETQFLGDDKLQCIARIIRQSLASGQPINQRQLDRLQ